MKKLHTAVAALVASIVISGLALPAILFAATPTTINLGTANTFAILSKTGITTTGSTMVTGDIGVSPIAATSITGFSLSLPSASSFATSPLVNGKVYAPGYANPTPANLSAAVGDMQTAYTDGSGRASTVTELGAGNIGGLTLVAGVYKWGTGVTIPTNVTLSGSATDVWIFQVGQTLTVSSGVKIILSGGAQASNIFWIVAGQTTVGTTAVFNGNIIDQTAIVLNTGAVLNGRALAQTAVTLDSNAVTMPIPVVATPIVVTPPPTPVLPPTNSSSGGTYSSSTVGNGSQNTTQTNVSSPNASSVLVNCAIGDKYSIWNGQLCGNNTVVSYNFGLMNLAEGSTGDAVMQLQMFLNAKLKLGLAVDGIIGPKTITVIKTWQGTHNLAVDGIVGPNTKASMTASF